MFSKIVKKGDFSLKSGVRSKYDYDYSLLSDTMNEAYCAALKHKLDKWQQKHGAFNVVVGIATEGIRIGYTLSKMMNLPFHLMPHKITDMQELDVPKYSADSHWLIVDDIVSTGMEFMRAVNFLGVEEKPETFTFACMIRRNPANLDYSQLKKASHQEQFFVSEERSEVVDRRLVYLYPEPE